MLAHPNWRQPADKFCVLCAVCCALLCLYVCMYVCIHSITLLQAISAMEAQMQQAAGRRRPDPPVDLRCPITCQLLVDPVILMDSAQTYEREAIQEWLDRGNRKDPVTGVRAVCVCGGACGGGGSSRV